MSLKMLMMYGILKQKAIKEAIQEVSIPPEVIETTYQDLCLKSLENIIKKIEKRPPSFYGEKLEVVASLFIAAYSPEEIC
ncbi:MAG: hypothetical protein J7L47_06965, partial [Candidatus Odinarchaeota archaeon]|nr:hypothetical protein [Candidatus Odinarchaeota archaeon]